MLGPWLPPPASWLLSTSGCTFPGHGTNLGSGIIDIGRLTFRAANKSWRRPQRGTELHSHNLNCTPCPRCLNGPEATSSLGGCCTMFRQIIEFPFLEILDLGPELDMKKWVKTGKNGSKFFFGCHILLRPCFAAILKKSTLNTGCRKYQKEKV